MEGEGSITDQTIEDDLKRDAEFKKETKRNKCKAGDKRYCSYAENHPLETFTFVATGFIGGQLVEVFILGGGAAGAADWLTWRAGLSCIKSAVCRSITGMAGGAGAVSTNSTYNRYMTKAELDAIRESSGYLRGGNPGPTFFTEQSYGTVSGAQQALSLKTPPQIGVQFQIVNNPAISGTTVVEKIPSLTSGGGTQLWSFDKVQVIITKVWELIQ